MSGPDARRRWGLGVLGVVAFLLLLRYVNLPGIPCLFHSLTGYPCPGCGTTRAVRALARLDFAAAFAMNPLFMVALVVGLGAAVVRAGSDFGWWAPRARSWSSPWVAVGLGAALMANWAYLLSTGR